MEPPQSHGDPDDLPDDPESGLNVMSEGDPVGTPDQASAIQSDRAHAGSIGYHNEITEPRIQPGIDSPRGQKFLDPGAGHPLSRRLESLFPAIASGVHAVPLSDPPRILIEHPGSSEWMILDADEYRLFRHMDGQRSLMELFYLDMQSRVGMELHSLALLVQTLAIRGFITGMSSDLVESTRPVEIVQSRAQRILAKIRARLSRPVGPLRASAGISPSRLGAIASSSLGVAGTALLALTALVLLSRDPISSTIDPIGWGELGAARREWTAYPLGVFVLGLATWCLANLSLFVSGTCLVGVPDHLPTLALETIAGIPTVCRERKAFSCATVTSRRLSSAVSVLVPGSICGAMTLLLAAFLAYDPSLAPSVFIQLTGKLAWASALVCIVTLCPFGEGPGAHMIRDLIGDDRPVQRAMRYVSIGLASRLLKRHMPSKQEICYVAAASAITTWCFLVLLIIYWLFVVSLLPLLLDVVLADSTATRVILGGLFAALTAPIVLSGMGVLVYATYRTAVLFWFSDRFWRPRLFVPLATAVCIALPLALLVMKGSGVPERLYRRLSLALIVAMSVMTPVVAMGVSRYFRRSRLQSAFRYLSFYYLVALCFIPPFIVNLQLLDVTIESPRLLLFFGFDSLAFVFLFPFFIYVFVDLKGRMVAILALITPFALSCAYFGNTHDALFEPIGAVFLSIAAHICFSLLAFLCLLSSTNTPLSGFWYLWAGSLLFSGISKMPQFYVLMEPKQAELASFTLTVRSLASVMGFAALLSYLGAFRRLSRPPIEREDSRPGPEGRHLIEGFCRFVNACMWTLRNHLGKTRADSVLDRVRHCLNEHDLPIQVVAHRLHFREVEHMPDPATISDELQNIVATLFTGIQYLAGDRFLDRSVREARDRLYWEESELVSYYILRDLGRRFVREDVPLNPIRDERLQFLARIPLFHRLEAEELESLVQRMQLEHYEPGQNVVRQGDPGETFYVIRHGHASVHVADASGVENRVDRLSTGDCFGEIALLENVPRTASVRGETHLAVLTLSARDFQGIINKTSQTGDRIIPFVRYGTFLSRVPLFSDLPTASILLLAQQLKEELISAGLDVIREGEDGDRFYLLKEGRVEVVKNGEVIADLTTGDYFGEIALITHEPRTATVRTLTDCVLLSIGMEDFYHALSGFVSTMNNLKELADRRLGELRDT